MATEEQIRGLLSQYVTMDVMKDATGKLQAAITEDVAKKFDQMFETRKGEFEATMTAKIKDLEKQIENDKKGNKSKEMFCMTTRRNFPSLPKYNGTHAHFEDWIFKMRTFLSEEVE